jgi:hypothetical protein
VLTISHYKDLVARIKLDNRALKQLTSQSIRLEISRRGRDRAKRLNHLRKYILGIYIAVGSAFRCKCKDQHQAGLSLARGNREQFLSPDYNTKYLFRVLISGTSIPPVTG